MKGEISPEIYEEWNRETGSAKLPERVKPKRKPARKRKRKARRTSARKARRPVKAVKPKPRRKGRSR